MAYKIRTTICLQCNKEFSGRFSSNRKFCSITCRQRYHNNPSRNPSKSPSARAKISASRKGKPTSLGLRCSKEKKAKISKTLTGRVMPEVQKIKISLKLKGRKTWKTRINILIGDKHPNWRGGYSKKRQARYNEPEYKEFVGNVLKRDNYTCQLCGARNGNGKKIFFQVHHKIHYWENPNLKYDIDNGITLCRDCHRKSHKGMKKPVVGIL